MLAETEIALVLLQTIPALVGLLLVFLVFAISKLIDLRAVDRPATTEIANYSMLAYMSSSAILVSLTATVYTFGWLREWWSSFDVIVALFFASLGSVVALTLMSLKRGGLLG